MLGLLKPKAVHENGAATIKPKVLIGVAGFHGVVPECQENFFAFAMRTAKDNPNFDFCLKIIIKREQFRARNSLVDLAIVNGCDWLLMLDDDMVIPPDLFTRLVGHNKDVIGALYYQRGGSFHPVLMRQVNKKDGLKGIDFIHHFDPMLKQPGLYQFDGVIGGGCMLFKTEIFRKIQQPYFWIDGIVGTDVHVCNQLIEAGVKLWVDTSIELGHVGEAVVYTSRNIPQYGRVLGEVNEQLWNDLRAYLTMDDLQLESEMIRSMAGDARKGEWEKAPRETWEQVREYYQGGGRWAVLNLSGYNLRFDQAREWTINHLAKILPKGGTVADYGAGVGYVSLPLVERHGLTVTALDVDRSPLMEFLRWRVAEHKLEDRLHVLGFETVLPPDLPEPVDAVVMISVFDHLYDPIGALDWVTRNVKPGGYWVVDSWRSLPIETEPQHLLKYDAHRIQREFKARGWQETAENPCLLRKDL